MTKVIALKAFPYSDDGIQTRKVAADTEFDASDRALNNLVSSGFVRVVGSARTVVEPIADTAREDEKPVRSKRKAKSFPERDT